MLVCVNMEKKGFFLCRKLFDDKRVKKKMREEKKKSIKREKKAQAEKGV